jgi:hypothetical protein
MIGTLMVSATNMFLLHRNLPWRKLTRRTREPIMIAEIDGVTLAQTLGEI